MILNLPLKNLSKLYRIWFVGIWLSLTSCTTVLIHDVEECTEYGSEGATCNHMLNNEKFDIPKAKWDDLRFGAIVISPDAWGHIKEQMEELCKTSHSCVYDQTSDQYFSRPASGTSE